MQIRALTWRELPRLAEIDRTEEVHALYRWVDGRLLHDAVQLSVPTWDEEGIRTRIGRLERVVREGGVAFGAFAEEQEPGGPDRLVAIAVLSGGFLPDKRGLLELVQLHVSNGYRRRGIASALMIEVLRTARARGAQGLYISASETDSAQGFYASLGARPTDRVDPERFAHEPTDIHMVLLL
ncbi:MAG: GNAT family N-acetyltransferase [Anaerolineae bacterium]